MIEIDDMTTAGYTGLEIDMLSLGDADAILVTGHREGSAPKHILIDGGDASDATTVRDFLRDRGIDRIAHLVSTHPHDDHAAGLEKLVQDHSLEIGVAWIHRPQIHVANAKAWAGSFSDAVQQTEVVFQEAARIQAEIGFKSVTTSLSLEKLLAARSIPIREPFAGQTIDFLTVCGPTRTYYEELLQDFPTSIRGVAIRETMAYLSEGLIKGAKADLAMAKPLLDNPDCGPINNSTRLL